MRPACLRYSQAFSLTEILVVVAIISLLAGLSTVGIVKAIESGEKAKAKGDMMAVVAALKAYRLEYGQWPTATGDRREDEWFGPGNYGSEENGKTLIKILMGSNLAVASVGQNPKQIAFLEGGKVAASRRDNTGGQFLDPWGTQYGFKVDSNESGDMEYCSPSGPNVPNLKLTVIGVSLGKDKKQQEIEMADKKWDDILSWRD
jgi:prepilin-type N-terminal cleavage/methylation domain-containing protein